MKTAIQELDYMVSTAYHNTGNKYKQLAYANVRQWIKKFAGEEQSQIEAAWNDGQFDGRMMIRSTASDYYLTTFTKTDKNGE